MKKKKITIGNGLNKMVYNRDETPVDGIKLPFDQLAILYNEGEKLGVELASQMVAYLKVFAGAKGFDAMAMFDMLTPKFTKEAQEMLEEIEAEKRQQQTGYKFLDLSCARDRKEFNKIMKNLKNEAE